MRGREVGKRGVLLLGLCCLLVTPLPALAEIPASPSERGGEVTLPESWTTALTEIGANRYEEALPLLKSLLTHPAGKPERRRILFLLGYLHLKTGSPVDALSFLQQALPAYPLIADYILALLAEAAMTAGEKGVTLEALTRLHTEHPDSRLTLESTLLLGSLLRERGDRKKAEDLYLASLDRAPRSPYRTGILLALAALLSEDGRSEKAQEILRTIWLTWPETPEAETALETLSSLSPRLPFTPDELFERAVRLHTMGAHPKALIALSLFLSDNTPRGERSRLLSGMSHFALRNYREASEAFASFRTPQGEKSSPLRAEALVWLGRSVRRLNHWEDALARWEEVLRDHRTSPWADDALLHIASTLADEGESERALAAYTRFLQEFPHSPLTDSALWGRGWLRYRRAEFPEAIHDFLTLTSQHPSSPLLSATFFWTARAQENMRKKKEAITTYRRLLSRGVEDYYQMRAQERLALLDPRAEGAERPLPLPSANSRPPAASAARAAVAHELATLRLYDEALAEYWDLVPAHPADRGLLNDACALFLDLRRFEKAVWVARRFLRPLQIQEGTAPLPRYWECLYPRGHWDLILSQPPVKQATLDPYLVLAVIREESAFAPAALSRAGARGLMQLLPTTAERVSQESPPSRLNGNSLDIPETNIPLGVRYLAQMLTEFSGEWTLALAAYNAGPHQVRRWVNTIGYPSAEEFTEEIPFAETRNYVKRVLGSFYRYRLLYDPAFRIAPGVSETAPPPGPDSP